MLSTFFRSAAQATDSTLIGCKANNALTTKLGQASPVARRKSKNSSTALAACNKRLT